MEKNGAAAAALIGFATRSGNECSSGIRSRSDPHPCCNPSCWPLPRRSVPKLAAGAGRGPRGGCGEARTGAAECGPARRGGGGGRGGAGGRGGGSGAGGGGGRAGGGGRGGGGAPRGSRRAATIIPAN